MTIADCVCRKLGGGGDPIYGQVHKEKKGEGKTVEGDTDRGKVARFQKYSYSYPYSDCLIFCENTSYHKRFLKIIIFCLKILQNFKFCFPLRLLSTFSPFVSQ